MQVNQLTQQKPLISNLIKGFLLRAFCFEGLLIQKTLLKINNSFENTARHSSEASYAKAHKTKATKPPRRYPSARLFKQLLATKTSIY